MRKIFLLNQLMMALLLFTNITVLNAQSNVLVNNNNGASTTLGFTQSSTSILAFGNHVLIAFNDAGSYPTSNSKFTGFAYSSDGGTSFTDGGALPFSAQGDAGEPALAMDTTTGRIYFATIQFSGNGVYVFRSDDNALTWMSPVSAAPSQTADDLPSIAVDNFQGSGNGNVYLMTCSFATGQNMFFFRSTDHGATFGPNGGVLLNSTNAPQGGFVTVGPDHSVYAFWYEKLTSSIKMSKSTDFGVSFSAAVTVVSGLSSGGTNGDLGLTGIRQGTSTATSFRTNKFPQVAINPVSGHIYVTYNNQGAGADKADIFFVMSTDGGVSWSLPTKVNDDFTTADQWEPAIAVTPDGSHLGIFYYSRQEDVSNNLFKYYSRIASISGSTVSFGTSSAVSNTASYPEFGRDAIVNAVYMTDFNHAVTTENGFYVSWFDARDDLAGGAGRKDPNVYFSFFPVTGPAQNHCPTATAMNVSTVLNTVVKFQLQGADSDKDPLTYTISQDPTHGTAIIVGGDSIMYTPTAGYSGADQLKYKVSDGQCDAEATVDIAIVICPTGYGYWKNHPGAWPLSATPMILGTVPYTQTQLLTILNTPIGNGNTADASLILADQEIAAKLNLANGTPTTPEVNSALALANALIGGSFIPMKVRINTVLGQQMIAVASVLSNFNSGSMTPGCGALITKANNINEEKIIATGYMLEQNYPNPFDNITTIRYHLPVASHVQLKIYDATGKEIASLIDEFQDAGIKSLNFNAANLSAGVYYCRLSADSFSEIKKMILSK